MKYCDVYAIELHRKEDEPEFFKVGDFIRTGLNRYPHFEILHIIDDRAWVRNVTNGQEQIAWLGIARRISGPDGDLQPRRALDATI